MQHTGDRALPSCPHEVCIIHLSILHISKLLSQIREINVFFKDTFFNLGEIKCVHPSYFDLLHYLVAGPCDNKSQ